MPIVLYLTTDCNLNCEYCYEADNREQLKQQLELDMDAAIKQMEESYLDRENQGNCVVLFGGEPFLRYDLMKQIFEYNRSKFNNYYCFSINTNALLLTEEMLSEIKEYMKDMIITVVISYDGIGTYRRVHYDGTSAKNEIEEKIELINKMQMPFGISYTIHKGNYRINDIVKDTVILFEKYKYLDKIEFSYYTDELDDVTDDTHQHIYNLLQKLVSVYKIYHKPMCCSKLNIENHENVTSPICKLCHRCNVNDNRIYVTKNGVIKKDRYESDGKFNQWKDE